MEDLIYLDYAATTPVDPRVLKAMLPYFIYKYGNPSSIHGFGQAAENAIETAREVVAGVLNCTPKEVVFTSCGSEADNLAIRGAALALREKKGTDQVLSSLAEHHAVSHTLQSMEKYMGFRAGWMPVDEAGMLQPGTVSDAISDKTSLISVMLANNEIGTINPVAEIARECHARGVLLHSDAVQAAAWLPLDVKQLDVDMLSLGAHKFYGPKGVGALYVREGTPILPIQTGGGQEQGLRAGTQNVPYIVGLAEALKLTAEEREARVGLVKPMRDRIINSVLSSIPEVRLTGHPLNRLPNHCSFAFKDTDGNLLLNLLDQAGFACSSGSACKTGSPEPSEVMGLLGLSREWGLGSLRVTLGVFTTMEQVEKFLTSLPDLVKKARQLS